MSGFVLAYGEARIPYRVAYADQLTTRVAIHVSPDGSVSVDAPHGFDGQSVRNAVQKRARWIVAHVNDAHRRHAHVRPKEYVSGEQVLYLGRRYMLKVLPVDQKPTPSRLIGNELQVETKLRTAEDIKGRIKAWYRFRGREYFARHITSLAKTLPWVDQVPPFQLLEMSRQWGSCSPSGEIFLNPHLIKANRACIEYVLVHEMAHLKHHDHGKEFWALIEKQMPDWRKTKLHLDSLVEVLLT